MSARHRKKVANRTPGRHRMRLALESLEIAGGHDGLFRGKPEPVLLVGAYRGRQDAPPAVIGRLLARAVPRGEFPSKVGLAGHELQYDTRFGQEQHVIVLALAVEEDNGRGVAALYDALGSPERLLAYGPEDPVPSPAGIAQLAQRTYLPPAARKVELLVDERLAREVGAGDKYVAAGAFAVRGVDATEETWRVDFCDANKLNDWTLVTRIRIA